MGQVNYLLRLDDACPTMNRDHWDRLESILDVYHIKPMVGIVPNCNDAELLIDKFDIAFWQKAIDWQNKGWAIALHGYDHCYVSDNGLAGLNPLWKRSEFAGVPLYIQSEKIEKGVAILENHGLNPKYFFAPSHTFDKNTLCAIREKSNIRIISDTIATKPYQWNGFVFIPQLGGQCRRRWIPGFWTFCLHPNQMDEEAFTKTEVFLRNYHSSFISFEDMNLANLKGKDWFSRFLSHCYFAYRRMRRFV